jgi:hypothetical protein
MPDKRALLTAAGRYLKAHPDEILRAARNAVVLRFGLPLDAFRWLATQAQGARAPKDVQIDAAPPGVRIAATVELMGTAVRACAVVFVERVVAGETEFLVELRLAEVTLQLADESAETPIAALLKSGALDLSRPGNLAAYMPKRPAMLVDAKDDRIVLDLLKHPKFAKNGTARRLLGLVQPLVRVEAVRTDPAEHLDVSLRAFPSGFGNAVQELRRQF